MIKISKQDAQKIRRKFPKLHFTINTTPSYAYIPESVDFKVFAEQRFNDLADAVDAFKETNQNFDDVAQFKNDAEIKLLETENCNKIVGLKQLIWSLENTFPYDTARIPTILRSLKYTLNSLEKPQFRSCKK